MGSGIEIERRWLLKSIPENIDLSKYKKSIISQWYIYNDPVIRLRSHDDTSFVLCVKTKGIEGKLGVNECESPLTKDEFWRLQHTFINKNPITKTRYCIPIRPKFMFSETAELDIFGGSLDGLIIVEVEFKSEKDAHDFIVPEWFGDNEITGNPLYSNATLYINQPDELL